MGARDGTDPSGGPERSVVGEAAGPLLDAAAATIAARRVASQRTRLHHRPGRSATRVETALVVRDGQQGPTDEVLLVAHTHGAGLPDGAHRVPRDGGDVAVWAYPDDPYLPGLREAVDPDWVGRQLRLAGWDVASVTVRRRAYRATRAAVIEATATDAAGRRRRAFVKVLRPRRARRLARVHHHLRDHLPVPAVLAHHGSSLLLDGLPGTTLRRALRGGDRLPDPTTLVALTTRLRDAAVDTAGDPDARAHPAPHVAALRAALPDLDAPVGRVVEAATAVGGPRGTVHGDLHGGQLLVADGTVVGVLDLDDVGPGYLAHDVGNLIAYLQVQGEGHVPAAARYAAEVAGAYRDLLDGTDLARATAGRWLALAAVAHRHGDEATVRRRVDRATQLVERT